jgi:sugar/nucleoside kinase (ribokinase family)
MNNSLLVVGSIAYDDVETPLGQRKDLLGGSATYCTLSASSLTAPRLVGVVGRDFRAEDLELFQSRAVDLDGLVHDSAGDTFRWGGCYHANMNDRTTIYTHLNVFETFQPTIPESYLDSRFVFLGNIAPELQLDVLSQINAPEFVALDTMNFWIDSKRDVLEQALSRVQGLIINDEEGLLLTGARSVLAVGRELQAKGPRTVIIKRGEHGALMFHHDELFYVPGFPVESVVDPTGAGDTFAGGFMGFLARTGEITPSTLRQAMVVGSIMASFCVAGFGLERLAQVTLEDVKTRYKHFVTLTQCPVLHI